MPTTERNSVFVSYAKEDSKVAAQLMAKLVPIARERVLRVFWDEEIKPGRDWHREILDALERASVGILLVSDSFLASRYIAEVELPYLIGEAKAGRVELFWFLLTSSLYEHTPLATFQAAHDPAKPLIQMDKAGVDAVFGRAAHKVADLLLPGMAVELPSPATKITRQRVGTQPEHRYSTGAAASRVAEEAADAVSDGSVSSLDALFNYAEERAFALRGTMIPFRHFYKLGEHYPLPSWPHEPAVLAEYLGRWTDYITDSNEQVGREFARYVGRSGGLFALAEYSRAVLSGLRAAANNNRDAFRITMGMRPTAEVVEEPDAFAYRLRQDGWSNVGEPLSYEEWIAFLKNAAEPHARDAYGPHVRMVLFGAEGLTSDGGVVFPQRLLDIEIDWLKRLREIPGTKVVCAAESYKVMPPEVDEALQDLVDAGRFTIVPAGVFDALVTDHGVLYPQPNGTFDTTGVRSAVLEASRDILDGLTAGQRRLPFAQSPDRLLAAVNVVAADVDDTVTANGRISADVVASLKMLGSDGYHVVFITGRSAGWGQALARYLPGVGAVVAENGLVLCRGDESLIPLRPDAADLDLDELAHIANRLQTRFGLEATQDDTFRLYERTFLRPDRVGEIATQIWAELDGAYEIVASSIHVHLRHRGWDKSSGLHAALGHLGITLPTSILVVGDSPNDRPLFRDYPDQSVGVANVLHYAEELGDDQPRWVTAGAEARGFMEIAERTLAARANNP